MHSSAEEQKEIKSLGVPVYDAKNDPPQCNSGCTCPIDWDLSDHVMSLQLVRDMWSCFQSTARVPCEAEVLYLIIADHLCPMLIQVEALMLLGCKTFMGSLASVKISL